jgi:Uma2 family endonuclease
MATIIHPATEIYYPDSDGQPMAESDFQREPLIYAVESLRIHFRQRKDVYVSGNMFLYYEEGNPKAVVAPDVFVVIGAPNRDRYSYKLWQEPKGPDFVLEITSKSTRTEDRGAKRGIYALLGVSEYWQYDPTGDYLKPPLQAYRLIGENYWPLPAATRSDGSRVMHSAVLGLELRLENGILRFYDPLTGQKLLSHEESEQTRREAEQAHQQAEQARQQAEQARQQAEQARQQAEQARQEAEEWARREAEERQALEVRLAELEQRLRKADNQ